MTEFNNKIQARFREMCSTGKLFRAAISGHDLWAIYKESFVNDPIFRDPASSEHTCNQCNNFMRRYGNIVAIHPTTLKIVTMFDIEIEGEYKPVAENLSRAIKASRIENIFTEALYDLEKLKYEVIKPSAKTYRLGLDKNVKRYTQEEADKFGVVKANEIRTFNHMHLEVPAQFVITGASIESHMAGFRDAKNVFQRAMETISLDTYNLVKDLIVQGSLLDGQTHVHKIEKMILLKTAYEEVSPSERDNWCWVASHNLPIAKFRNELIGVLCSELSEGEDINTACQSWNKRVDPANYMKVKSPITAKQIAEAKEFVESNGYTESFNRRMATIDDIKASEIKHLNISSEPIKGVSIFDGVKATSTQHKRAKFEGVEEVTIDKFMNDILPGCTSVEAYLDNKHEGNLVSLTTANNPESKPIFKWDNNYSWTYKGNLAGKSMIKEAVKGLGGKVDGDLRFSIMWAEDSNDNSDLDAHCIEPNMNRIYFSSRISPFSGGNLDIDITQPQHHKAQGKPVVENISFPSKGRMREGKYQFLVNQFADRGSIGFKAEIEFNGEIYQYEFNKGIRSGSVAVATITLKDGLFTIEHHLPETTATKVMYGLETNNFHKVNLISLSPNHWGSNSVGNKHYLFMLDKCKADTGIRGFHNENLIPELLTHRKVMDVLGSTSNIPSTERQLSGLGFNATVKDELIVKVSGSFKRMLKIKF